MLRKIIGTMLLLVAAVMAQAQDTPMTATVLNLGSEPWRLRTLPPPTLDLSAPHLEPLDTTTYTVEPGSRLSMDFTQLDWYGTRVLRLTDHRGVSDCVLVLTRSQETGVSLKILPDFGEEDRVPGSVYAMDGQTVAIVEDSFDSDSAPKVLPRKGGRKGQGHLVPRNLF